MDDLQKSSTPSKLKLPFLWLKNMVTKRNLLLLLGFILAIILLIFLTFIFGSKKNLKTPLSEIKATQVMEENQKDDSIPASLIQSLPRVDSILALKNNDADINGLIKKATTLYEDGKKIEALNVFESISMFSRSLASYNLGAIALKQKDFSQALNSFIDTINSKEDLSLANLAAGIASRYLGNEKAYEYYLQQAKIYLPYESKTPFYSYLYSLINYYDHNYFSALSGINNPSSPSYIPDSSLLATKLYLVFGDNQNAIKALEQSPEPTHNLKNLALLYARIGDYENSEELLLKYEKSYPGDIQGQMALELITLKRGKYLEAAKILDKFKSQNLYSSIKDIYPIKITLHPRLFDIELAQDHFVQKVLHEDSLAIRILFYYAPLKVFDANKAINRLKQSNHWISLNILDSKKEMIQTQTLLDIDEQIIKAILSIEKKDLRGALNLLKDTAKNNPNHSILHYNLGILYAQMGDYDRAYNHLLKSYYLDPMQVDSGLLAILAGKILQINTDRVKVDVTRDLEALDASIAERNFLYSLLNYTNDVIPNNVPYLDERKNWPAIYYALEGVYGLKQQNYPQAVDGFNKLIRIYPNDLIALSLKEITMGVKENPKEIALRMYKVLMDKNLDLENVYYGPEVARDLYAYMGFITGSTKMQEDRLLNKLINTQENTQGILQLQALLSIYEHKFEQATTLYNTLINEFKEEDSKTHFLLAVAEIGMKSYDRAALALQLAKLNSESNFEARLALGLLYQQTNNFEAASSHFNLIAQKNLSPDYFDFTIDTPKILTSLNSSSPSDISANSNTSTSLGNQNNE